MNPNTRDFESCDMCHIGLNKFGYHARTQDPWQTITGEPKKEWDGVIERTQLEEYMKDGRLACSAVRIRRRVKKLCGDCYEKYALPQLRQTDDESKLQKVV